MCFSFPLGVNPDALLRPEILEQPQSEPPQKPPSPKLRRARDSQGRLKGDDPNTPDTDEAWETPADATTAPEVPSDPPAPDPTPDRES